MPPREIYSHISGIDLVKGKNEEWYILEDNLRVPFGASYLAEKTGAYLVNGSELMVENDRLYYITASGEKKRVGAVYRRISDEYLDPMNFNLLSNWSYGEDGWKNKTIYGCIQKAHDMFNFRIHGKVEIRPVKYEEEADWYQMGMYRYPFGKCCPGEGLRQYFSVIDLKDCVSVLEKSMRIMHILHQLFSYGSMSGLCTYFYCAAQTGWYPCQICMWVAGKRRCQSCMGRIIGGRSQQQDVCAVVKQII